MTENDAKYERQGAQAFYRREPRESCRYKKPALMKAWQAGWDRRAEESARADAKAKIPRWESYGDNSWSTPKPATAYYLRGDAPGISVYRESYISDAWFASYHVWGIAGVRLDSVDPEDAKREAILKIAEIARGRVADIEGIADAAGDLLDRG